MSLPENHYKNFPALAAYIDRIGASELSFKTFMVETWIDHYYREKSYIRIDTDARTISSSNPAYAPSDAEEMAILEELQGRVFPTPIGADSTNSLIRHIESKGQRVDKNDLFELWDRETNKIVMVQRRYQKDESTPKKYHPWTLWSDGVWRQMEPGGPLTFWKPRQKLSNLIMVHEGAKAARFCEWLARDISHEAVEARKTHPWAEELQRYEHWGIIGGALAPHRANFAELRRERPTEVVYVADNDDSGRRVLNTFSRMYEGQLKWVKFDSRWPTAWDLADAIPNTKDFFATTPGETEPHYKGPTLTSLLKPATYATEKIPNPEGRGAPVTILRSCFADEWLHSVDPELFVHRDYPNILLTANQFNSENAPFSQVDDLSRLVKRDASNKMFAISYSPKSPPGLSGDIERGQFINTYTPSTVKILKGDPQPWLDYMQHLLPVDSDRYEVLRWCATLIAKPEVKMTYGLLLVSENQGVGKTTLGEKILIPLVGPHNASTPNEKEIVDSEFNEWLAHKRLALINEIYAGNSNKAYNTLKSYITDKTVRVNKKHQSRYEIENWTHIMACSNSMRALKVAMEDRRWLIPKVTEEPKPHAYWQSFLSWLENGGLEIINWWAREWLKTNPPVLAGEIAPDTNAKDEMIEEGFSKGMIHAKWCLETMKKTAAEEGRSLFVTDAGIIRAIKDKEYDGRDNQFLEKPLTIRKLAKKLGLFVGEHRSRVFSSGAENSRLIATSYGLAMADHEELKKKGEKPFDISIIGQKM